VLCRSGRAGKFRVVEVDERGGTGSSTDDREGGGEVVEMAEPEARVCSVGAVSERARRKISCF
jgi:hypothetical protein